MLVNVDLDGESWRIAAPDGSRVVRDEEYPWRMRLVVPEGLTPLSCWEVIARAERSECGLRVVGYPIAGLSSAIVSAGETSGMPLFEGGFFP